MYSFRYFTFAKNAFTLYKVHVTFKLFKDENWSSKPMYVKNFFGHFVHI